MTVSVQNLPNVFSPFSFVLCYQMFLESFLYGRDWKSPVLLSRSRAPFGLWMSSPAPHCKSLSCQVSWLIKLHMPVSLFFFHLANRGERKLDLRIERCSLKSPFLPPAFEVLANVSFKCSFPFCFVARGWAALNTWQHLSNNEMIYKTGIFL